MAENNAASIERLVSEIRIIRKGDYDHRIQMNTDDEFTEVGYQVNHMLDSIQALNDRNTELLKLNSRIEMDQLTAQMNPHFLYNTLEIIRNLVVFDADKAFEDLPKILPIVRGQRAWHVFPDSPPWVFSIRRLPHLPYDAHGLKEQAGTPAAEPFALPRNGQVLTGGAEGDNVYWFQPYAAQGEDISIVFHPGEPFLRYPDWERLDLRRPYGAHPRQLPGEGEAADAVKQASQRQWPAHQPPPFLCQPLSW